MSTGRTHTLSIVDAAFFLAESDTRMSNIGPLAILRPPARARSSVSFASQLLKRMKQRPVGAPFNLKFRPPGLQGLPALEEVSDVNLDQHCHLHPLAAPGSDAQLFELVCRLHVRRLDLSRPPWEMHLIEGLAGGRVAVYAKVHHGLIDGRGFVQLIGNWFSADASDRSARALWDGLPPRRRTQADASPLRDAAAVLNTLGAAAKTVGSLYAGLARQALASAQLAPGMPLPFVGTSRALQGKPSIQRCFAYCVLPLAELKAFGKAHEATVNDMLLTVLDMALNRYLAERGTDAGAPLVADMPVALGGADSADSARTGNHIAVLQFPLGAAAASPLERLQQIRQHTAEVKQHVKRSDAAALVAYTTLVHLVPALLEVAGLPPQLVLANAVISNPFGLPERRYLAGAEVEMALPVSLLMPGQTLNITAATYDQGLQIAFLGLQAEVPDVQRVAELTSQAFAELTAAAHGSPSAPSSAPPARAKRAAPRAVQPRT